MTFCQSLATNSSRSTWYPAVFILGLVKLNRTTAGHRGGKEAPVCRSRHVDGTRRPARRATEWTPADCRRKRGRPKKTWQSIFREDLQARGVSWSEKETMATDRVRWRNLLPIVPQGTGF